MSIDDLYIIARTAAKIQDDGFDTDPPWNFSLAFDLTNDGRIMIGDLYLAAVNSGKQCPWRRQKAAEGGIGPLFR